MRNYKEIKFLKLKSKFIADLEVNSLTLKSCKGRSQRGAVGFVNPIEDRDDLVIEHNHLVFLCLGIETKVLPAKVIQQTTQEKIKDLEKSRYVSKKEAHEIKENTELALSLEAFTLLKRVDLYIDTFYEYIAINSTTESDIKLVMMMLAKIGVVYKKIYPHSETFLTYWFLHDEYPETIAFHDKCKLATSTKENNLSLIANGPAGWEKIKSLSTGYSPIKELQVTWQEELAFTITSDMKFKSVKILDFFNHNSSDDDLTNLLLMADLFSKLFLDIKNWNVIEESLND